MTNQIVRLKWLLGTGSPNCIEFCAVHSIAPLSMRLLYSISLPGAFRAILSRRKHVNKGKKLIHLKLV